MGESWASEHLRENPGHLVHLSIYRPAWCEICGEQDLMAGLTRMPSREELDA